MKKKQLTCDDLEKFLTPYEPVSIAYKLYVTQKGIDSKENDLVAMYCHFDTTGAKGNGASIQ